MNLLRRLLTKTAGPRLLAAALLATLAAAAPGRASPESSGDELRLAIILTRHGVRAPLLANEAMAKYASQPWPKWEVEPSIQTPHGNQLIALMGDYYRVRFMASGLLSGDPAVDGPLVFVRADNDQRTIETGRILGKALVPVGEPDVHALPKGTLDPLFQPYRAHVGHPDASLAAASVLGRLGGDPRNIDQAYATQLGELREILFGHGGVAPPSSAFDEPTRVLPGQGHYLVSLSGPLLAAEVCTDSLLLEYTDGMPLSDVGWGKVDRKVMTDLLALHELLFDLTDRTFYPAQVNASNLASHILDTLEQGAEGEPVPGALGPSGERIVILGGHDSNIASVGGLFGMNWWVPGTQINPMLPGGALVFELWKRGGQDGFYVRTSYVTQTLDQLRDATALSLDNPPARAPIFVPGCSGPGPSFDAPLASFVRQARKVIDPSFIAPEP
jgi:4-phytase / acid phosphatase